MSALKPLRWRRVGARLIDSLLLVLLISLVIGLIATDAVPYAHQVGPVLLVVANLWYLFCDVFPLGKRLMGLGVVHAQTGSPCTPGQSLTRNLTLASYSGIQGLVVLFFGTWKAFKAAHPLAALALGLFSLALALVEAKRVDDGRPRLGDQWATTTVVDLRAPQRPPGVEVAPPP